MEVFSLVALGALNVKVVSFLKFLTNKDMNGVVTQLIAWGAGIGTTLLFSGAHVLDHININGYLFGDLNTAAKVIFGVTLGSLGSFAVDFKKARDNNDTAAEPALLPGNTSTQ